MDEVIDNIEEIEIILDADLSEDIDDVGFYPYDPLEKDLDIREEKWSIYDYVRKIDQGKIIIDPEFQRNFVWQTDQKNEFIESIILGLPIPPFYLNEDKDGNYLVVDGRQRSTTIYGFLKDKFFLENLKAVPYFNGKKFSSLLENDKTKKYQARIEDKQLTLYIISKNVPIKVVYDIFNRINTNGTQLNNQEIRNCLYAGNATKLLKKLSEENEFIKAIDRGVSPLRMKDREFVLRYLAFKNTDYKMSYIGDMGGYLDYYMSLMYKMNEEQLNEIGNDFIDTMKKINTIITNKSAFRLPTEQRRGLVIVAIYDAVSIAISNISWDIVMESKNELRRAYNNLINDNEFLEVVRQSTNNKTKLLKRFEIAENFLKV